jgi:malate permease and related proteins
VILYLITVLSQPHRIFSADLSDYLPLRLDRLFGKPGSQPPCSNLIRETMWEILIGLAWTNLGLLISRCLSDSAPRRLGRILFWFGIPVQVFALAHKSNFSDTPWLPAMIVLGVLGFGFSLSYCVLGGIKAISKFYKHWKAQWLFNNMQSLAPLEAYSLPCRNTLTVGYDQSSTTEWMDKHSFQGSFILAAMLGNTMFIGMAIVPPLVAPQYLGWIVIFGIVHYLLGSYGVGVILANYYGQSKQSRSYWVHLTNLFRVPTFWTFILGYFSQSIYFPKEVDWVLQVALWSGVPTVFMLLGLQLGKLHGSNQLRIAFFPALIKTLFLPGLVGLGLMTIGIPSGARFAIVLMTGMPTNSANLILAEEYRLDPQLAASSIVISTLLLPLTIPLWYMLFH